MKNIFLKVSLIILLTIPPFQNIIAQSSDDISIESFQKKYPAAAGVILDHTQTISISVNKKTGELDIIETDYEEVLYISPAAKYYTDQSITTSDFFEDITEINALVITPEGKKLKLKKDEFRKVDAARESWVFHDENKEINFSFDDLDVGYKTIITYTKKVKKPEFFDVFHFISGLPCLKSTIDITYPNSMEIAFYDYAFKKYTIQKEENALKKDLTQVVYTMQDVPEYRVEDGAVTTRKNIPQVVAQIKSYQYKGVKKEVISDITGLHAYFQEFLLAKGDESNRKELNTVVRKIIKNKETQKEKMDTIFTWVQDNIKYLAFEDGINGYVPRSCSEVMKNRFGDCKDMGNLLVEMLTFAGVEGAYVAWVGTRDIPYNMGEIPVPFACNHVICVVDKPEGGYYYLDATNSEADYNLPPRGCQGKDLLIHLGTDKFKLFEVPPVEASKNYFKTVISYTFVEGDSIRGTGIDYYGGYERSNRAYYINNQDEEDRWDYIRGLTLGSENKYDLKSYTVDNLDNRNEELRINYEFAAGGILIPYNGDYIFNPSLFRPYLSRYNDEDNQFSRHKNHHRTVDYIFQFTVPEGYRIKEIPENINYEYDLFRFKGTFTLSEDGVLTVSHHYQYDLLEIPTELYSQWNELSRAVQASTDKNIILEKIQ